METTEYLRLINTATDQNRALYDTQIETKTFETFSNAIKVARSLNVAIKNMCPACLDELRRSLQEGQAKAVITGGQKDK